MENGPFENTLLLKMGRFNCYVSLPEGTIFINIGEITHWSDHHWSVHFLSRDIQVDVRHLRLWISFVRVDVHSSPRCSSPFVGSWSQESLEWIALASLKLTKMHLKIGRAPIGKACFPTIHFQGRAVSFREGSLLPPPPKMKECHLRRDHFFKEINGIPTFPTIHFQVDIR